MKRILENKIGERPSWDEYFMGIAILTASRSSCRHVEAGSVIVQNKQIIGTGYNGAPPGFENCLEAGCRKEKKGLSYHESLNTGTCIGVHSEMNALGHLRIANSRNIELYTTIFPCHTCAKNLLPYGITKVVFKSLYDKEELKSTQELFEEANVEVFRLDLSPERYNDIAMGKSEKTFRIWDPDETKRLNIK